MYDKKERIKSEYFTKTVNEKWCVYIYFTFVCHVRNSHCLLSQMTKSDEEDDVGFVIGEWNSVLQLGHPWHFESAELVYGHLDTEKHKLEKRLYIKNDGFCSSIFLGKSSFYSAEVKKKNEFLHSWIFI